MNFFSDLSNQFSQAFIGPSGDRWIRYLEGLEKSFVATLGALALGLALGVLVAVIRTYHDQTPAKDRNVLINILNGIMQAFITVIRGTPMMIQLLFFSMVVFADSRHFMLVGIFGMGINAAAYIAEIIRGGIMAVDKGQMEAGRSLGMGYGTVMKDIIIPQSIKGIFPAMVNEFITLFKDTSLLAYIAVTELTKVAIQMQARTYQPFMTLVGAAVLYLIVVVIIEFFLRKLERRLRRSDGH